MNARRAGRGEADAVRGGTPQTGAHGPRIGRGGDGVCAHAERRCRAASAPRETVRKASPWEPRGRPPSRTSSSRGPTACGSQVSAHAAPAPSTRRGGAATAAGHGPVRVVAPRRARLRRGGHPRGLLSCMHVCMSYDSRYAVVAYARSRAPRPVPAHPRNDGAVIHPSISGGDRGRPGSAPFHRSTTGTGLTPRGDHATGDLLQPWGTFWRTSDGSPGAGPLPRRRCRPARPRGRGVDLMSDLEEAKKIFDKVEAEAAKPTPQRECDTRAD